MLTAFKTYDQCQVEQRPLGIPLDAVWMTAVIDDAQVPLYQSNGWIVTSNANYDEYVANLADKLAEWEATRTQLSIAQIVEAARTFGMQLMVNFASENILLGITQDGKTGEVLTKMANVMPSLQAGSLYEAINQLKAIPPEQYDTKYVTAARLLSAVNKIETYLNIPLSTEL